MKQLFYNYERTKLIVFVLLIASFPFHHIISSLLIMVGILITLVEIFRNKGMGITGWDRLSILFILFFVLEIIGLAYTDFENLRIGFFNLEKHMSLVLIPFIYFDFKINEKSRSVLLVSFVAACFVATIVCIVGNIYISITEFDSFAHEWRFSHNRFSEPIGLQAVYFALYLSFSFLIAFDYLKRNYDRLSLAGKSLIVLLLLYFFILIIFLAARTIAATLLVLVVVMMIRYAMQRKSFILMMVTTLIPIVFIASIFFQPIVKMRFMDMMQSNYENTNYGSYFSRTHIWGPGWEAIQENIWLGVGTVDDQAELNKKFIEHNYLFGVDLFNMHNQYLQVLLTYGIVGFGFFAYILFVLLKDSIEKKDLLYLSFLILFMGGCLTESMLCRSKGIIYFIVFCFIFYKSTPEIAREQYGVGKLKEI